MMDKLRGALGEMLTEINPKNIVRQVYSPLAASESDYLLLVTPIPFGTRVAIHDILVNRTFYTNEYRDSAFVSANQAIETIVSDVQTGALKSMPDCR
ncbi:MAG: hypothetical protein RBT63_08660 [Bdellovibrionales bacterium]|jgi:hypothetical protein|nr:hypothetical protein [Bdellovibrionales bacterium]